MRYYIYALKSLKYNRIYVGITKNPNIRLKYHNRGFVKSTKFYRPWTLIYAYEYQFRSIARQAEKYFKSGYGREIIKEIAKIMGL